MKKDKSKGIIKTLITLFVIAAIAVVAFQGIGKQHKGSAQNIRLGLDLAGGVSVTYQTVEDNPAQSDMDDTVYKLQRRVQEINTEATVYQEGNNRINVDIPGVENADEILAKLGQAGSLQFKDESGNVVIDGSDIQTAEAGQQTGSNGVNDNVVKLTLKEEAKGTFATATANNIGKTISIVYDGQEIQSPTVQSTISDGVAYITHQSSYESAQELATIIRIGALPLELTQLRYNIVGAKLGTEAVNTSLLAGVIGLILVLAFMLILYRIPGIAADLALLFYVGAMVVILNALNITLTLPGIAGIILSIGMAVDANVIIFTRIREELGKEKTVRSSIKLGFDKALSAIIDGNVTTLLAAAVLYIKGSGTIKGFATTLAIGILLSMFTSLVVTRFVLQGLYQLGLDKEKMYGVAKEVKVRHFVKHRVKFLIISGAMILAGFVAMFIHGQNGSALNYGLDFMGGTSTEVSFQGEMTDDAKNQVATAVATLLGQQPDISKVEDANTLLIKTTELSTEESAALRDLLVNDYQADSQSIQMESISATVSGEMKTDAVVAVIVASVIILLYIWFRFKDLNFGLSSVLALVHDVLVVLTVYAIARISVGNTFIACMLTIVGYSINATIVVFDRIRENRKEAGKNVSLAEIVDLSISQTLSRSINTSLTTLFMVLSLVIVGVSSIREFAIPLLVGIICGAYSSVCVAGTLWYTFRTKFGKKVEA